MDQLEERITKIEQSTGEELTQNVDNIKKEILDTIKGDIETVVNART